MCFCLFVCLFFKESSSIFKWDKSDSFEQKGPLSHKSWTFLHLHDLVAVSLCLSEAEVKIIFLKIYIVQVTLDNKVHVVKSRS